jgi:hypothetical protein
MIYYMIFALLLPFHSLSQNLGIGTNNPQATLDLRGNYRSGGQNSFLSYDSLSGKIGWSNSFLYVPGGAQLIQHSASAEGLYYANSSLQYLNQLGNPVFSTNWINGTSYFSGKLGIGTSNPLAKLHVQTGISGASVFSSGPFVTESSGNNYLSFYTPDNFQSAILFEKQGYVQSGGIFYNNPASPDGIIFRGNNATRMTLTNAGNLGIGAVPDFPRLLVMDGSSGTTFHRTGLTMERNGSAYINIITPDANESGVLFGTSSNAASGGIVYNNPGTPNGMQFRTNGNATRMVLTSLGRLGIGNFDPGYILDVNRRMRIRAGADINNTAGIWLNNNANALTAFMGMQDDTHVGFYGTVSGWGISMNTNSGALKINGTEGTPGQVITSNGASAQQWKSPTKFIYDNTVMKVQNVDLTLSGAPTALPNLTHTFTVPANAKALVSMSLNTQTIACTLCGSSRVFVAIEVDGLFITNFFRDIGNNRIKVFRAEYVVSLTAGTHTIRLVTYGTGPSTKIWGTSTFQSNMIIEVIPETF